MCDEVIIFWIFFYISTVENAIELQFKIDNIQFFEPLANPVLYKALASSLEKEVSTVVYWTTV